MCRIDPTLIKRSVAQGGRQQCTLKLVVVCSRQGHAVTQNNESTLRELDKNKIVYST